MRMNPFRYGLIAFALAAGPVGGVQAQSTGTEAAAPAWSTFNAERWQRLSAAGEAFAGIRSPSDAGLVLLMCIAKERLVTLTFHPAPPSGLAKPPQVATLAFDGAASLGAELTASEAPDGSILFVLHDDEPGFRATIGNLMTAHALEIDVVQADTVQSRHKFTLKGSGAAMKPVLKLCGR
jgi:hypothetical protein